MGLKKVLWAAPLMFVACAVSPGKESFIGNLYNQRLKAAGSGSSTITVSTGDGTVSVKSTAVDDTLVILRDWSISEALARHKNNLTGKVNYINLKISGGSVYRSAFFPTKEEVGQSTAADILYLEKIKT